MSTNNGRNILLSVLNSLHSWIKFSRRLSTAGLRFPLRVSFVPSVSVERKGILCGPVLFALLAAGCQTAHVDEPLTQKLGGADPGTQLEFWHQLADRPITSNDEAFHGFLLYLDGQDPNNDYAARVSAMKSRGLLPAGFNKPANQAVTRGDLAVAIANALQIKGGVVMRLGGARVPRYATRELIYLDVYPPSSPNQTFSGTEFLGIMGKVEDWQNGNVTDIPAAVLPGEVKQ